ncbi:MAG: hypothetical protein WC701_11875 [Kiritimatiellales bacterium]|jgi:hypothetical protein
MLRFLKVLAVVLAIGALIAPVPACADSHDVDCCMDCSCVCHCVAFSNCRDNASEVMAPVSQQAVVFESGCLGILLVADIFRPPTLA